MAQSNTKRKNIKNLCHIAVTGTRIINLLVITLLVIVVLPIVVSLFDNANSYNYIRFMLDIDKKICLSVKKILPTIVHGMDITRGLIIILSIILIKVMLVFRKKLYFKIRELKKIIEFFSDNTAPGEIRKGNSLFRTITNILKTSIFRRESELRILLNKMVRLKNKLEKWHRQVTLVSIDVIHSAEMKLGEDPSMVDYDFRKYMNFVQDVLHASDSISSTWTPDGVMACFKDFESAFKATKDVINGLEEFNSKKNITSDFNVRCGINTGKIYFDESIPLEEIRDRAIDIAGHAQKAASRNSIIVTRHSIYPDELYRYFDTIDQNVDGLEVCVWRV
ncbi:MAG: hypothetical protein ABIH89_05745, partial [Elusimicrobiota bacterium]